MAGSLELYQIYFKEEQLKELYPFAIPYYNKTLTNYFENSVIAEIVPNSRAEYIGVCSWMLRKKRGDTRRHTQGELTEEKILNNDADVMILTPRSPRHQPLAMARIWHKPNWDIALNKLKEFIKVPNELKTTIYENHFIANGQIYRQYVNECLIPVLGFMDQHKEFEMDSNYANIKMRGDSQNVKEYRERSGRNDWPIAPFVLERLFSIWINDKGLKVIPL